MKRCIAKEEGSCRERKKHSPHRVVCENKALQYNRSLQALSLVVF